MRVVSPLSSERAPGVLAAADGVIGHPRATLSWSTRSHIRLTVITLHGDLDIDTAAALDELLCPLTRTGRHLVVDLAGLRACDRAGLSLFLRWKSAATAAAGSLCLATVPLAVRRLITTVRSHDVLPFAVDTVGAITALGRDVATAQVSEAKRVVWW
jgi:anti-anti-sigma factor